jgi:hypothetical protein
MTMFAIAIAATLTHPAVFLCIAPRRGTQIDIARACGRATNGTNRTTDKRAGRRASASCRTDCGASTGAKHTARKCAITRRRAATSNNQSRSHYGSQSECFEFHHAVSSS